MTNYVTYAMTQSSMPTHEMLFGQPKTLKVTLPSITAAQPVVRKHSLYPSISTKQARDAFIKASNRS